MLRISGDTAIAQTVDFFTPIVDDPFIFGAIAAANSVSDIYAMGATPILGLAIAAFPTDKLPLETLHEILRGGATKAAEAGFPSPAATRSSTTFRSTASRSPES